MSVPASAREQPRADPVVFGMVLFLASEVMFFGALFGAYFFLRSTTSPWPPDGVRLDALEPVLATALLVASSGTVQLAERSAERADPRRASLLLLATVALGLVFLGSQVRTWFTDEFGIASHAYGTLFYAMTGFHALHVSAGLILMVAVLPVTLAAIRTGRSRGPLTATIYYWHFVDVVWLGLFATLYLVQ